LPNYLLTISTRLRPPPGAPMHLKTSFMPLLPVIIMAKDQAANMPPLPRNILGFGLSSPKALHASIGKI